MRNVFLLASIAIILAGCAYGYEAPEGARDNPKKIPEDQGISLFELGSKSKPTADSSAEPQEAGQYDTPPVSTDPEYQEYLEWKEWQEFKKYQEWKRQQDGASAS